MAERRMFAKSIVLSDAFLDLPMSARCLYFTLGMLADDDGFVNAPRSIMRQCGASDDDMKILLAKKFALVFESGVIVIKHWRINNYLRNDRYTETKYIEEKAQLSVGENGAYHKEEMLTPGIPNTGIPKDGIPSIGKVSIGKISLGKVIEAGEPPKKNTTFKTPSLEEVKAYCDERQNSVDPQRFVDYYSANGWMVGRNHMKDWKAAVRTWEKNGFKATGGKVQASGNYGKTDLSDLKSMMKKRDNR